jgi:hypothetical protein
MRERFEHGAAAEDRSPVQREPRHPAQSMRSATLANLLLTSQLRTVLQRALRVLRTRSSWHFPAVRIPCAALRVSSTLVERTVYLLLVVVHVSLLCR